MLRKTILGLLAAAALPFAAHAAPSCSALNQPQSAAGVIATEMLWVKALETRDTAALSCILAPGFMDAAWNGEMHTREEVLAGLKGRPPIGIHLSDMKVSFVQGHAIVRGVNTATRNAKPIARVTFEDIFVYREGRWQALTAQETVTR